jgi:thiol-disulfide isomerase/thioredoxin
MWPRLSILAGLVAGVLAAVLVIGGIVAFAPAPIPAATQPPRPSMSIGLVGTPTPAPTPSAAPADSGLASASPSSSPGASTAVFHVGQAAPELVVPRVGGGMIDLANLRGKPVWVNFMGTYCPPCLDEFPLMNGFAAKYASTGLVILAIDVKEDEGTIAAFAEQLGATFPLGRDADGSAADRWDAIALPVHFWVDKDAIIRDGALGGIGSDVMARGLGSILPGVTVTP